MPIKDSILPKRLLNEDFRARYSQIFMIYLFLILFMLGISFCNDDFLTISNLKNLLVGAFPLLMAAFAQTLVILTGGIDLSIGGIISVANVSCVACMTRFPQSAFGCALGVLTAIVSGLLCGLINGLFVTRGRIPSIIVTIATMTIFEGVALYILPVPGGSVHSAFAQFLTGDLFGVPLALLLLILATVILRVLTNSTPFGKALRAVGGNESAAYSTGIVVWKVELWAYLLAGLFCSFAGIFLAAEMYSGDPTVGNTFSMNSITATVVGGTLMTGAVGDILGSIAGVFIIYIINNMLNLLGVSSYYQFIFQGLILIFALITSSLKSQKK